MKTKFGLVLLVVLALVSLISAQEVKPATVASAIGILVSSVERELVPAAEAMPEDKYSFAPTNGEFKEARTFAAQIKHIAGVNYMLGSAILGEKPPVDTNENGPESIKTKTDIVKFLKGSFAYVHKAVDTITTSNQVASIKSPFSGYPDTTRLTVATFAVGHSYDHYGQVVIYLRMNGIIPPASRA